MSGFRRTFDRETLCGGDLGFTPFLNSLKSRITPEVAQALVVIFTALVEEPASPITPVKKKRAKKSKPRCTAHHPRLGRVPGMPCVRERGHRGHHRTATGVNWKRRGSK